MLNYHKDTPQGVINALESARARRVRVRVWYGKDGTSWDEENDIMGYIGSSTGPKCIPLMVNNNRSMGGPHLLDHCIVKIVETADHTILYKHPQFKQGVFTAQGETGNTKDNFWTWAQVLRDGKAWAPQCKSRLAAERLAAFMNGIRMSK